MPRLGVEIRRRADVLVKFGVSSR